MADEDADFRNTEMKDYRMPTYDLNNPHPGFKKDPNIKNEFGHTEYPKFVKGKDGKPVVVETPEEEEAITGVDEEEVSVKPPKKWK